MGQLRVHSPALLFLAAFSRYDAALDWARDRAAETWGEIAHQSPRFEFTQTDYYQAEMGTGLRKTFWVFDQPFDPAELPRIKLLTNTWEQQYAAATPTPELRPLNLDPGYLTLAKLVLASTKDHSHRVYLSEGIYGEVTLYYSGGRWQAREWTYADYRRDDYQEFFTQCREDLHRRIRQGRLT